jgi:hypothetical protein
MKMEQIECSETSAYKIQTPGNHPEENIQHTEHGESLKSKKLYAVCVTFLILLEIHKRQLQEKFCTAHSISNISGSAAEEIMWVNVHGHTRNKTLN